MTKTILFLGASPQQLAPLNYARRAGHRIITCDNRPENPGHKLADRSYNVSTTDFEGVLQVARQEHIDGVVCYASDVSAPAAAFVGEKLGLPGNPLRSVEILTNKAKFREFQKSTGLYAPRHVCFAAEDLLDPLSCLEVIRTRLLFPLIVKPVDASGARGVVKLSDERNLVDALSSAIEFSRARSAIVEEVVTPLGFQVCGEGFLQSGHIIFLALANEHFVDGITVPVGETFPAMFSEDLEDAARGVLQKIMSDLRMNQGPFNFDLFFLATGEVFVIEIGPRAGGNRMPEAIFHASRVDMVGATVEVALGNQVTLERKTNHYCATYSIHSKTHGLIRRIDYSDRLKEAMVDEQLFLSPGEMVERFTMGSAMVGNLILSFSSYTEMLRMMAQMEKHVVVTVEPLVPSAVGLPLAAKAGAG